MADKGKIIWWVVAVRVILIGPFYVVIKIGEQCEKIADFLTYRLPHPMKYPREKCPACGGYGGVDHFFDKQWEDCSRCNGKGWIKK